MVDYFSLDKYIVFHVDEETESLPQTIEISHFPAHIPDGYALIEEVTLGDSVEITYKNEKQNELTFEQYTIGSRSLGVDTEGGLIEDIFVGAYEAKYFSNKGIQQLIWTDGIYGYHIFGSISKEEIILMAESVK